MLKGGVDTGLWHDRRHPPHVRLQQGCPHVDVCRCWIRRSTSFQLSCKGVQGSCRSWIDHEVPAQQEGCRCLAGADAWLAEWKAAS